MAGAGEEEAETGIGDSNPGKDGDDKRTNVKCYHCNEMGHYANKCPKKRDGKVAGSTLLEPQLFAALVESCACEVFDLTDGESVASEHDCLDGWTAWHEQDDAGSLLDVGWSPGRWLLAMDLWKIMSVADSSLSVVEDGILGVAQTEQIWFC